MAVEGGPELRRELDDAGRTGEAAFRQVGTAADAAAASTDRLTEKARQAAQAAQTVRPSSPAPAASGPAPASSPATPLPVMPSPTALHEAERVRFRLDAEARNAVQLERDTAAIARAEASGTYTTAYATRLRELADRRYGNGNDNEPTRRGLDAEQRKGLTYQAIDVATSVGGGMPLGMVAVQQGGQIYQSLAMGEGGIRGGLKALGQSALGLVTPMSVAATATAALGTAFVVAASQAGSERAELEKATAGLGRATGATAGGLALLARASADAGRVSTSTAREIAATYAGTGNIALPVIGDLTRSTAEFARVTGTDVPTATAQLAAIFSDPAKGADQLAKSIGGLDDQTRQLIIRQAEQGNTAGAQATLARSLDTTLQQNTRTVTGLAAGYEVAATAAGKFWDATKRKAGQVTGAAPETPEEALARLNERIANANQILAFSGRAPLGLGSDLIRERDAAQILADTARREATAKAAEEAADKSSVRAGDLARSLDPMGAQLRALETQRSTLQAALTDPLARNKLDDVKQVEEAFARVTRQIATMRQDMIEFGDTAVANLNRTADFALKTVGYSPLARATAEAQKGYEDSLQSKSLAPTGPSSASIRADYDRRLASVSLDLVERYNLAQERDAILKPAVEREGYQAVRDKEIERARLEALRGSANGSRYSIGVAQAPEQYRRAILDSAARYGQDPDLMAAMLRRESRFNPNAVSPAGAQGIAQFMPGTAERFGLTNPFDAAQSIDRMGRYLQVLDRQFGGNTADMVAAYNRGEGAQAKWIAEGRDPARVPKEARGYLAEIFTQGPGTAELVRDQEARARGLQQERDALRLTTEAGGRDREGTLARIETMRRIADEQGRGITVSQEYAAQIGREAQERQRIVSDGRFFQYTQDAAFQRSQLGRTEGEARGAYVARSLGYDLDSPRGQVVMQTEAMNEELRTTKQVAGEAFTGLLTDLRRGTDLASSLNGIAGRIADRFIGRTIDSFLSSAFAGEGKDGGGWITSALAAAKTATGFSDGGYTGHGARYDVAGLVHRGEVVFSQADVARHGGVAAVEVLRRSDGIRGYDNGGIVGPQRDAFTMPSSKAMQPAGGPSAVTVNVSNVPADMTATAQVQQGPRGPSIDVVLEKAVAGLMHGGRLDRALKNRMNHLGAAGRRG